MSSGEKKMEWWQWLCMQDELVLEPDAVGTIAEHAPRAQTPGDSVSEGRPIIEAREGGKIKNS